MAIVWDSPVPMTTYRTGADALKFRAVLKRREAQCLPASTVRGVDCAVTKREPQTIVVLVAVWWVRTLIPLLYDLPLQDLSQVDIVSTAKFQPVVNIRVICVFG